MTKIVVNDQFIQIKNPSTLPIAFSIYTWMTT